MHLDTIDLFLFFVQANANQSTTQNPTFLCVGIKTFCVSNTWTYLMDGEDMGFGNYARAQKKAFWIVNQPVSKLWMFFR